jgi:tryptophanyl-tRNA synthetase
MSKSDHDPGSRILLTDPPEAIHAKVKKAVTDSVPGVSWDPAGRPGVSNLIRILAACEEELEGDRRTDTEHAGEEGDGSAERVAARYAGADGVGRGIKDLKADVAEAIVEMLRAPRAELERLRGEAGYLEHVASDGAERAREAGRATLWEVKESVGLA